MEISVIYKVLDGTKKRGTYLSQTSSSPDTSNNKLMNEYCSSYVRFSGDKKKNRSSFLMVDRNIYITHIRFSRRQKKEPIYHKPVLRVVFIYYVNSNRPISLRPQPVTIYKGFG